MPRGGLVRARGRMGGGARSPEAVPSGKRPKGASAPAYAAHIRTRAGIRSGHMGAAHTGQRASADCRDGPRTLCRMRAADLAWRPRGRPPCGKNMEKPQARRKGRQNTRDQNPPVTVWQVRAADYPANTPDTHEERHAAVVAGCKSAHMRISMSAAYRSITYLESLLRVPQLH